MERILLLASVLLGGLVWVVSAWLTPRPATPPSAPPPPVDFADRRSLWRTPLGGTALALPVIGFLLTLPTSGRFFSPGQDLGRGFLIGGLAALLAAWPLLRDRRSGATDEAAAPEGAFGLAAVAASLAVLFLRGGVIDALAGVAIGWFATAFPIWLLTRREQRPATALVAGAGFTATLCGAAALGIWRDEATPDLARTTWSAITLAFAALSALVLLVFRIATPKSAAVVPPVAYAVIAAGAMKLFAVKIAPEPKLFWALAAGLIVWPIAAWLLRDAAARDTARNPRSLAAGLPPLSVLLLASGFLVAYQLLRGVGAGIFVLALWLSAAAFPRRSVRAMGADIALLLFATLLLLDRVFTTRYAEEMRGVVLTDQYGLFGLMVGALTPGLLASLVGRRSAMGLGGILTLILAGTLSLGVPAIVVLLFGGKSALALLLGLALGSAQAFRAGSDPDGILIAPGTSLLPGQFALAIALAMVQFTGALLPLTEMTRQHKVQLLGVLVAGVVIALLAAEFASRSRLGAGNPAAEEVA